MQMVAQWFAVKIIKKLTIVPFWAWLCLFALTLTQKKKDNVQRFELSKQRLQVHRRDNKELPGIQLYIKLNNCIKNNNKNKIINIIYLESISK